MRKKTRKRRRGVALTEALISLCMLVVLFAGVVFFHRMYGAKTATMQQARMQAWAATRFDCNGASAGGDVKLNVAIPMPIRVTQSVEQRTISSGAELVCNLKPEQRDDVLGVLSWAIGTSTQGIASDSLATIGTEMLDTIWQSIQDAIPFL